MPLFKFSLILFLFSFRLLALEDNECLKSSYEVEVIHKGQPFGLLPVKLSISKKGCILNISHEKMRFFKKNWEVDVCREPVHIKNGRGAVEVLKKMGSCDASENTSFCNEQKELFKIIQDDGLIFAPGEKENLATDHGRVYCSYLLVKKYLKDSLVFNRGQDYSGALSGAGVRPQMTIEKEVVTEGDSSSSEAPRPTIVGGGASNQETPDSNDSDEPAVPQVNEEEKEGTGSF